MANSKTDTKPGDSGATETKATRERRFPIRQFSMLLDKFLTEHPSDGDSVDDLKGAVDKALLEHYKTTG